MGDPRLGDVIDDYCVKCRRLTNHSVVSMLNGEVAKVRCRSCYHDHDYLREQIPPSKKDLKKLELFNAVLGGADPAAAPVAIDDAELDLESEVLDPEAEKSQPEAEPEPEREPEPTPPPRAAAKKKGRAKKA
jgi:hypothetical protein